MDLAVAWGALIAGGLCGLMPLLVGSGNGQHGLGSVGFAVCLWLGWKWGIIGALPGSIVFTVIIVGAAAGGGGSGAGEDGSDSQ